MDGLFDAVKRKLRVTYDDAETDARIRDEIIPSAIRDLTDLLGIDDDSFDFAEPGTENMLFLAWCYYEWNNAIDDFEANYAGQIARCREKWMVRQYVEGQADADL